MKGQTEHSRTKKKKDADYKGGECYRIAQGLAQQAGTQVLIWAHVSLKTINWKRKGRKEYFQLSSCHIEHCSFSYLCSVIPHRHIKHAGHLLGDPGDLGPSFYQLVLMLCWTCYSQTRKTCRVMQGWRAALGAVAIMLWSLKSSEK